MKTIILKPVDLYLKTRQWVFSKRTWNAFYETVSLPELKCLKTIAFVVSIIL